MTVLALPRNAIIVLSGDTDPDVGPQMAEALAVLKREDVLVVWLGGDAKIETLSEDEMRTYGWVRAAPE